MQQMTFARGMNSHRAMKRLEVLITPLWSVIVLLAVGCVGSLDEYNQALNRGNALVANGGYTSANVKKRDFMVEEVLATSNRFFDYLTGVEEEGVDTSGVIEEPAFDQGTVS